MPIKLATIPNTVFWWQANGCPPTDYGKWHYLVNETIKHLTDRYGIDEVKTWYFEVWNEPNLGSFFRGTQEEYFKLYEVSVDAVKSVCTDYHVGGPSTSGADFREGLGYLKAFIDFCSNKELPLISFLLTLTLPAGLLMRKVLSIWDISAKKYVVSFLITSKLLLTIHLIRMLKFI